MPLRARAVLTSMLGAICVASAASPVSAAAAIVQRQLTSTGAIRIAYVGTGSEVNSLLVSKVPGSYVFHDTAGVSSIGSCSDAPNESSCSDVGVVEIRISLTAGDDDLTIDPSASPAVPAPGAPRIIAFGGAGADTVAGGLGPETLDGGDDNDPMVDGGGGDDEVTGGPGNDTVEGGDGNDRLDFPGADPLEDQSAGIDMLDGGAGNDQLNGGPPRSPQEGDTLDGGGGTDTADYSQRAAPLAIALDGVANDGEAGEGDNVAADVENVVGGSGRDTLVGSGAANALDGRDADDVIMGAGGDDTVAGANGNDSLSGGDGNDIVSGTDGDDSLDGGDGIDTLTGGGGTDAMAGGAGADTLAGGPGSDTLGGGDGDDVLDGAEAGLIGGDGNDTLRGDAGADKLRGGPGDDWLDGGVGADQINGEDGRDTLSYENRASSVTVTLDGRPNDGEVNEHDNVASDIEIVLGGTLSDTLTGDRNANILRGGLGEDLLTGNAGRDTLDAGGGPDIVWARDGNPDTVDCGGGGDLAVVDRDDDARDCRYSDRVGKRKPVFAQSALIRGRKYDYRLPDGRRDYTLEGSLRFPMGSRINARTATVRVTAATKDATQGMSVSGGPFTLRQRAGKRAATIYRFAAGPKRCSRSASVPNRRADEGAPRIVMKVNKRKRRRGQSQTQPDVVIAGDNSFGGAFGTKWITEERCSGTFTRVLSGVVRVRDLRRHKTVTVRAGDSYLARAR
jgi:Ca2+-binding RTX toxin-like protein